MYIEARSQPLKRRYFFAYRVRITNNSDRPVQLLRRHWIITDANGKTENVWWAILHVLSFVLRETFKDVLLYIWSCLIGRMWWLYFPSHLLLVFYYLLPFCRGVGVIGEQPVILPKTGFEYSSACPLSTPSGRMVRFYSSAYLCPQQYLKLKCLHVWNEISYIWNLVKIALSRVRRCSVAISLRSFGYPIFVYCLSDFSRANWNGNENLPYPTMHKPCLPHPN